MMNWLFAYPDRTGEEWKEPEIEKLSHLNPDGSYIGGAQISLLRIMQYLRKIGHRVDFDVPGLDSYDVLIACREPNLIERYPDLHLRRKYIWLKDINLREEFQRYRRQYDGAITVSPFLTSIYADLDPGILSSTNPMEPVKVPRSEPEYLSLCFAGVFIPGRGVDFALDVLALLQKRFPDCHLTLYGSYSLWMHPKHIIRYGCDKHYLPVVEKALARVRPGGVTFAGNVASIKLVKRFAGHHFLLVPARVPESCSIVSIEAQNVGTVVVASQEGALPDTVGPGGICLDLDPGLWVERIAEIYLSDWQDYSRAARAHFENRFTMDRTIESWICFMNLDENNYNVDSKHGG